MASVFKLPGLDRLGLSELVEEHERTLYRLDDQDHRHWRLADHLVLAGLPLIGGLAVVLLRLRATSLEPLLTGVSIIAGGLFSLLGLILAVQTLGGAIARITPPVRLLVRETRANVAYSVAVALALMTFLIFCEAFKAPTPDGADPVQVSRWLTAVAIAGLTHLLLVLFMVINRIRLAFNALG